MRQEIPEAGVGTAAEARGADPIRPPANIFGDQCTAQAVRQAVEGYPVEERSLQWGQEFGY